MSKHPDKPKEIVVLSAASGAPEPIQQASRHFGTGAKMEYNPMNREIIERITIWVMTPELYRFPPTQKELAKDLGISPSWVNKIKKRLPDNMPEFLNMAEDEALSNHRDVVRMITAQAIAGNNKAQVIYMKHIAESRKQAPATNFHFKSDIVNFGVNLIMGKNQQLQSVTKDIEGQVINSLDRLGESGKDGLDTNPGEIPRDNENSDKAAI